MGNFSQMVTISRVSAISRSLSIPSGGSAASWGLDYLKANAEPLGGDVQPVEPRSVDGDGDAEHHGDANRDMPAGHGRPSSACMRCCGACTASQHFEARHQLGNVGLQPVGTVNGPYRRDSRADAREGAAQALQPDGAHSPSSGLKVLTAVSNTAAS